MQRRTILFLSLALVAFASAGAAWWLGNGEAPPVPPLTGGAGPEPLPGKTPTPAVPPEPRAVANGTPRVRVEVVAGEKLVPPPPLRVQAVRAGDDVELPTVLLAGAGAGFDTSPHVAGAALCEIGTDGGRVLRQVAIAAGVVARPVVGARLTVQGHVRDGSGSALAGATVWFGESDVDGNRREWTTDVDGAFTADTAAGAGVPFVVRKDGFAAWWRPVDVTAPPRPCDAVLSPGCTLEVAVAGAADAIEQARLFVVPGGQVATGVAQWPFLLQVLADGYPFDGTGRATIPELPQGGEVALVVRHPRALRGAPHAVALKGERVHTSVPVRVSAGEWRGIVTDEQGQPLAGVDVWARRSARDLVPGASQRLLPPHLDERGVATTRTGADGTFAIAAVDAPDAVLSLRAPGCAGRDVPAPRTAGASLVLPAWRGGEPELVLQPPRAGIGWQVATNLGGGLTDAVAPGAAWRVSLPHAGFFDFLVTTTVDGELRGTQRFVGVAVTGTVELAAPKLE